MHCQETYTKKLPKPLIKASTLYLGSSPGDPIEDGQLLFATRVHELANKYQAHHPDHSSKAEGILCIHCVTRTLGTFREIHKDSIPKKPTTELGNIVGRRWLKWWWNTIIPTIGQ